MFAENTIIKKTTEKTALDLGIYTWIDAFLSDRRAQNLSKNTVNFYRWRLKLFTDFCEGEALQEVTQVTANDIRNFLNWLSDTGHNPGGQAACHRSLKAFFTWWENEVEPEAWTNPMSKVKAPKIAEERLEPANLEDIKALLKVCGNDRLGDRDRALILGLLDTGARAREFLALDLEDVDLVSGAVTIRRGKGGKSRTCFLGKAARKAVRNWVSKHHPGGAALFTAESGKRLGYTGLRLVMVRRAKQAKVPAPELHAFRRAFALNMLRNGANVYALQELMGHADLQILRRYLKLVTDDLKAAHDKGAPGDRL